MLPPRGLCRASASTRRARTAPFEFQVASYQWSGPVTVHARRARRDREIAVPPYASRCLLPQNTFAPAAGRSGTKLRLAAPLGDTTSGAKLAMRRAARPRP